MKHKKTSPSVRLLIGRAPANHYTAIREWLRFNPVNRDTFVFDGVAYLYSKNLVTRITPALTMPAGSASTATSVTLPSEWGIVRAE